MSKKFKAQASSARAASTAFGNGPSFGFGNPTSFQTSTSLLSYVNEQPDLSGISQPNVVVAFKSLSKKDSITKEKALDELNGYLSSGSASHEFVIDDAVIDAWTTIFPRISIDNSRRVRQLAHNFQGTLTSLSGKRIASRLPKVIGTWLAGTYDQDRGVARAASEALQKSFNSIEKRRSLWKVYQKTLVEYVEDAATGQTANTLSDERNTSPDDAEAKYVRVVATALSMLNSLLHEQGSRFAQNVSNELSELLKSTKLWEHAYGSDASVRRASYTLFMTVLVRRPEDVTWKTMSFSLLGKGLHVDQLGSTGSFSEALLAMTRAHPETWTTEYSSKISASKRLLKFLQRGSQRGPAAFWNNMSHLIELLPKDIWISPSEDSAIKDFNCGSIQHILEAYRTGITSVDEPRQNLKTAWETYIEFSIWLCGQLQEEGEKISALNDHVLPIVRQYVNETVQLSGFTLPRSLAQNICVKTLAEVAVKFRPSVVERFWEDLAEDLLEAVKISQPEQSSTFKTSQDEIVSRSQRFFGISAGLLDTLKQSQGESAESLIRIPVQSLVEQCTRILGNRVGKPYGAANVVRDAVDLVIHKSYDTALAVVELVTDFLDDQLGNLIDSPSADVLVSLLLELRDSPAVSHRVETIIGSLLDADDLDASKSMFQSLLLAMDETDLQRYPKVRQSLLRQLETAIAGDTESWKATATVLRRQSPNSTLKMDMLSRMFDGLSTESTAHNSIRGFNVLLGEDCKVPLEQVLGPSNTSNLLSRLLVLEEMPYDGVSHDAHELAERIQQTLKKAGLASKASIEIIRQQLPMVGQEALSIHTVIELAREALVPNVHLDENLPRDIFPEEAEWRNAVEPFLLYTPSPSIGITSLLQGAAMMIDEHEGHSKVEHDADGFSAAVRLGLFTTRLTQTTRALHLTTPAKRQAFYFYLPLVLQIINEKLDIDSANKTWTVETQEVEDEMTSLVSDGRRLLSDLISEQIQNDTLATLPDPSTLESCWLNHLEAIIDTSPRSYRIATAFADILSVCCDKAGVSRYSKIWSDAIADIRKSSATFKPAALVVVGKVGLLPMKKFCTELVVDITEMGRTDHEGSVLAPIVLLDLLLDGDDEVLSSLPTQRLVYLVKAVVTALGQPGIILKDAAEMLKLLTLVLPYVASIYDEFWKDLWISTFSMATTIEPSENTAIPFLHSALKLFALYKRLSAEETNDDLVEVWEEHATELPRILTQTLLRFNLTERDQKREDPGSVRHGPFHDKHQPKSIVMGTIGRLLSTLPVDKVDHPEDLYPLVMSCEREAQSAAFDVLHRQIVDRQEQLSLDFVLSKQEIHVEQQLLSLLPHVDPIEVISDSTQLANIRWTAPRGYLLAWKLVFDHFTKASHKLREIYAEDIRASGSLGAVLGLINDLLKVSSTRPVDPSRSSIDVFDFDENKNEPHLAEAQALGAHLYYLCLLYLPNLTRTWWFESKNKVKGPLESWTQKHITPKLCKAAMSSVNEWMMTLDTSDDEEHALEVKISPNSTELVASIPVDPEAAPVSIMISLPPAYPLQQAIVTSRNRVAVSESNWQSWLRTIRGIIMFSNGSLIDGLLAFRRNVQGALKGQTECAICYSIIGTDMKTPDKRCGTCKRLFHGVCLLRWFRSSNSSSCPLCRNNFSYA